jgi:hypothetical protein
MLEDKIDVFVIFCTDGFLEVDYIRVFQLTEEHHLTVSTLSIGGVRESIEILLQCLDSFGLLVNNLPDVSIGPASNLLDDLVALEYVRFNLISHG